MDPCNYVSVVYPGTRIDQGLHLPLSRSTYLKYKIRSWWSKLLGGKAPTVKYMKNAHLYRNYRVIGHHIGATLGGGGYYREFVKRTCDKCGHEEIFARDSNR